MMEFLPTNHPKLEFTMCFRLSAAHAAMLGEIWGKNIVGVNSDCKTLTLDLEGAVEFLSQQDAGDILCMGSNTGSRSGVLNILEKDFPSKFNKNTVWSKITDNDGSSTEPKSGVAIFTTCDISFGSKETAGIQPFPALHGQAHCPPCPAAERVRSAATG